MNSLDFRSLKKCFMKLLNKVALLKTNLLRANHSKFVTKEASKAIMSRTKLTNQFLKKRAQRHKVGTISRGILLSFLSKKLSEKIMKI